MPFTTVAEVIAKNENLHQAEQQKINVFDDYIRKYLASQIAMLASKATLESPSTGGNQGIDDYLHRACLAYIKSEAFENLKKELRLAGWTFELKIDDFDPTMDWSLYS